jgi:hypothetical protein
MVVVTVVHHGGGDELKQPVPAPGYSSDVLPGLQCSVPSTAYYSAMFSTAQNSILLSTRHCGFGRFVVVDTFVYSRQSASQSIELPAGR